MTPSAGLACHWQRFDTIGTVLCATAVILSFSAITRLHFIVLWQVAAKVGQLLCNCYTKGPFPEHSA
jgi:hypothetical protein